MLHADLGAARTAVAPYVATMPEHVGATTTHSVFGLLDCPPLGNCRFVLVNRAASDDRKVLQIGRLEKGTPTHNRAKLRHIGANCGVAINDIEVHVSLPATALGRH